MRLYWICILLVLTATCFANVLNVPGQYPSIQQAIHNSINGDTIVVATGRYFENINFLGKAVTVCSVNPNDPNIVAATIIDGNRPADANFGSVVTFKSGETNTSVLEGFTITGGTGSWLKVYWEYKGYLWNRCGGGVLCANYSSPTIRKNIFTNNIAGQGAGIYCYNHSNAFISDNTISDNNAFIHHGYADPDANDANVYDHGDGGAIVGFQYCDLTIKNNTIRHNHADLYGGGIHLRQWSDGLIENNLITQNWSTLGAGVHVTYTSAPTIRKNTIMENTAGPGGGGGIYIYFNSNALVEQNLITQNYCVNGAGIAVYYSSQPVIRNNLIIENISGAGIRARGIDSDPTIIFNTIANNSANINSGGIDCTENADPIIINNIIFSNCPGFGIYADSLSHPEIRYNNVWANEAGNYSSLIGDLTGTGGNISVDPAFINADSKDYHLNCSSPCVNAGDPNTTIDCNDFDGQNRKMGQFIDMGAYETKPAWNISKNKQYYNIQAAIDDANNNQTIVLIMDTHKGAGNKNVDFNGKAVTVQSINPDDLTVIQSTIVDCEDNGRAFVFDGGEDANAVIKGLTIVNGGGNYEGVIYCHGSSPTIKNCVIRNNSMQNGGAIYCGYNSNATIANCIITGNSAAIGGGGLFAYQSDPTFVNCSIIGNKALEGGGICSLNQSNPLAANCIVRNNTAVDGNQLALINTLRNDTEEEITEMTVSHSNIQEGRAGVCVDANMILHWENGNIDAEPNFADLGSWNDANTPLDANDDYYVIGNYHLLPGSVCENSGDNNFVPLQAHTDIDGEQRIFDGIADMGADEFATNIADFNSDGIVDFSDLYVLYEDWLDEADDSPADFIDDGLVDFADFAEFAENWLWKAGWR